MRNFSYFFCMLIIIMTTIDLKNNLIRYQGNELSIIIDNEMNLWFGTDSLLKILNLDTRIDSSRTGNSINVLVAVPFDDYITQEYIDESELCILLKKSKTHFFEDWLASELIPFFLEYSMNKIENDNSEKIKTLRNKILAAKKYKIKIGKQLDILSNDTTTQTGGMSSDNYTSIKNNYDNAVDDLEILQTMKDELIDENNYYVDLFKFMISHRK